MNKFVLRNIAQRLVHCMYVCVFYLILVCMLDTAGIGADKMPQEDISVVTEVDGVSVCERSALLLYLLFASY